VTNPVEIKLEEKANSTSPYSPLGHRHRRRALCCLADSDVALHLADLAQDIAKIESTGADTAQSLYTQLYHRHLPKLADAGLISFSPESKMVSLTADRDRIVLSLDNISVCEH
jgi:predicted transcriptional regulator